MIPVTKAIALKINVALNREPYLRLRHNPGGSFSPIGCKVTQGLLIQDALPRCFEMIHALHEFALHLVKPQSQSVSGVYIESIHRVLQSRCRKETSMSDLAILNH
jgi:hypothetical protein